MASPERLPVTTPAQFSAALADLTTRVHQRLQEQAASESGISPRLLQATARRRAQLLASLPENSLVLLPTATEKLRNGDAHFAFRPNSYFYYLTGFTEPGSVLALSTPARSGDSITTPDKGQMALFVQPKNPEREIWDGHRLGVEKASLLGADHAFSVEALEAELPGLLKGKKNLYVVSGIDPDFDTMLARTLASLGRLRAQGELLPELTGRLDGILDEMRLIKDEYEIETLQIAADISALGHLQAMRGSQEARYEFELQALTDGFFRRFNAAPAYTTIAGAGANACTLHYVSNHAPVGNNDLVLIDAGAEFDSYAGDITRTFPARGRFGEAQQQLYEAVLDAQQRALQALQPGRGAKDYHEAAVDAITRSLLRLGLLQGSVEDNIRSQAFRRFFMHGTGHWLGLDVHDAGCYRLPDSNVYRPLEPGMMLTVEPGIYVAANDSTVDEKWRGTGIRIEDDVLITENGPQVLTGWVPKTVQDIERWMQDVDVK